jgi:hypothetical protein
VVTESLADAALTVVVWCIAALMVLAVAYAAARLVVWIWRMAA